MEDRRTMIWKRCEKQGGPYHTSGPRDRAVGEEGEEAVCFGDRGPLGRARRGRNVLRGV